MYDTWREIPWLNFAKTLLIKLLLDLFQAGLDLFDIISHSLAEHIGHIQWQCFYDAGPDGLLQQSGILFLCDVHISRFQPAVHQLPFQCPHSCSSPDIICKMYLKAFFGNTGIDVEILADLGQYVIIFLFQLGICKLCLCKSIPPDQESIIYT